MQRIEANLIIGMPVYNGSNFIGETLDSILTQTYPNFKLIICDNASTDQTRQICEEAAATDLRVQYHHYEMNIGAALNYNRVLSLADTKYFKWAAHDDKLAPTFLESCIQRLEEDPDTVVAYPRTQMVDTVGELIGCYSDHLNLRSDDPIERFRQFFFNQGLCHPVFGVIRTGILQKTTGIGSYPMSDRVLLGELSLYGKFYEVEEHLFIRRIHPLISTIANKTDKEIAAWFNPANRYHILLPHWRRLFEYIKAIARSPLSPRDKARGLAFLSRFAFLPNRWKGMGSDLSQAVFGAYHGLAVPTKVPSQMKEKGI